MRERPGRDGAAHELAESVAIGRLAAAVARAGATCTRTRPGRDRRSTGVRIPSLVLTGERHEVVVTYPAELADRGLPVCYEADVWAGSPGSVPQSVPACTWLGTLYCGLSLNASPSALDGLVALLLDLPALTEAILAQTADADVALRLLTAVDPPTT